MTHTTKELQMTTDAHISHLNAGQRDALFFAEWARVRVRFAGFPATRTQPWSYACGH